MGFVLVAAPTSEPVELRVEQVGRSGGKSVALRVMVVSHAFSQTVKVREASLWPPHLFVRFQDAKGKVVKTDADAIIRCYFPDSGGDAEGATPRPESVLIPIGHQSFFGTLHRFQGPTFPGLRVTARVSTAGWEAPFPLPKVLVSKPIVIR